MWVKNEDQRSEAYNEMKDKFLPVARGLHLLRQIWHPRTGRAADASARETIGRVAAGAIAKKKFFLHEKFGVEVLAYVKQVQQIAAT